MRGGLIVTENFYLSNSVDLRVTYLFSSLDGVFNAKNARVAGRGGGVNSETFIKVDS